MHFCFGDDVACLYWWWLCLCLDIYFLKCVPGAGSWTWCLCNLNELGSQDHGTYNQGKPFESGWQYSETMKTTMNWATQQRSIRASEIWEGTRDMFASVWDYKAALWEDYVKRKKSKVSFTSLVMYKCFFFCIFFPSYFFLFSCL